MSDKTETCDICGYEGTTVTVHLFADGVFRCSVCSNRAAFGRYIPDREVSKMSDDEVVEFLQRYRAWKDSLIEKETGKRQ